MLRKANGERRKNALVFFCHIKANLSLIDETLSQMRPLRYSINVTLDGCCDHREMIADEDLHRHAMANIVQADALLFGRVTYEMMEAGCGVDPDGGDA
jgi:hypothetical protein